MKGSVLTTKTWFLLIGAVLLISAGLLNFRQRARQETPPWDGVEWVDTTEGIVARRVERGSAADRAWLVPGDILIGVSLNGTRAEEITSARDIQIYLEHARVGGQIHYLMKRPSYPTEVAAYWADLDKLGAIHKWTPRVIYINIIGLVYLFVGFFVLFKQGGRAPYALHFATFCLAAFVFLFYTPVGSYRDLDLGIAFLDNAALLLFPPLFLHFCALYPSRQQLFSTRRWRAVLLYVPALLLLAMSVVIFLRDELAKGFRAVQSIPVSEQLVQFFYWLGIAHLAVALIASAVLLLRTFIVARSTVVRQQVKWVMWGTLLAITPFVTLYAAVYLFGEPTDRWLNDVAIVPLAIIPFAFGYSVLRYRLMDVELVVRRVFVYALTTLAIALLLGVVVYTGGLYAFGSEQGFTSGEITLRLLVAVLAMAAVVMVAAPVKNFLQEQVDRIFYGERYDLRNSLLDFGRTLSATTALDPLLDSLVSRLQEVMNVERVAIYIESRNSRSGYVVARSAGLSDPVFVPPDFRDMIRVRSAETGIVRADDLDLNADSTVPVRSSLHYFVPASCAAEWSQCSDWAALSMVRCCLPKTSRFCALFRVMWRSRSKTACSTRISRNGQAS